MNRQTHWSIKVVLLNMLVLQEFQWGLETAQVVNCLPWVPSSAYRNMQRLQSSQHSMGGTSIAHPSPQALGINCG